MGRSRPAVGDSVRDALDTAAPSRRRALRLVAGAAVTVLLVGAGVVAACRQRARAAAPAGGTPALEAASLADVQRLVRAPGAKAVVVNVWATWCVPCREEMPDLLRVEREFRGRGVRLLLVSADFTRNAEQARAFLGRHGVGFQTYLKSGSDMEFIDGLSPKWSGALPATFVFDGAGALRQFWEGRATYETFAAAVGAVVEAPGGGTRG
jgi:thiol-disulfide isomerase/thioredoxin